MYFSTALVAAASAAIATAATISVEVGNGALTFSPNDIKANVGDSIEFSFFPKVLPFPLSASPKLTNTSPEPLRNSIQLRRPMPSPQGRILLNLHPHKRHVRPSLHHPHQRHKAYLDLLLAIKGVALPEWNGSSDQRAHNREHTRSIHQAGRQRNDFHLAP
jgi:hypothetical protein